MTSARSNASFLRKKKAAKSRAAFFSTKEANYQISSLGAEKQWHVGDFAHGLTGGLLNYRPKESGGRLGRYTWLQCRFPCDSVVGLYPGPSPPLNLTGVTGAG